MSMRCASSARQRSAAISRPESGSWQSFDVQLAFYALALAIIGLLMAWTNSPGGAARRRARRSPAA